MNNPLAELHDYHLPPPVTWWPPAYGWWLLLILILGLIGITIGIWWYRRKKFATVRYLQAELTNLKINLDKNGNLIPFIRGVSKLLRRFALIRFPRHQVAKLTGSEWLKFLDNHGGNGRFQTEFNWLLSYLPYQNEATFNSMATVEIKNVESLIKVIKDWLQHNQQISKL